MRKLILFLSLVSLSAGFSCKKESRCDCLKGEGKMSEKEIVLDHFRYLKVNSKIIVEIKIDSVWKMTVEAGKNLVPLVHEEIINDTLIITNHNKCNWIRSYDDEIHITLTVPTLEEIYQNGGGRIFSKDTLRTHQFTIDMKNGGDVDVLLHVDNSYLNNHDCPGDITAKGISGVSYVYNNGQGTIDARDLQTDITFLGSQSVGTCYVRAKDWLAVTLKYTGDVYYSGNPARLDQQILGSGKLIHQD